jgi:hypothetical protein
MEAAEHIDDCTEGIGFLRHMYFEVPTDIPVEVDNSYNGLKCNFQFNTRHIKMIFRSCPASNYQLENAHGFRVVARRRGNYT